MSALVPADDGLGAGRRGHDGGGEYNSSDDSGGSGVSDGAGGEHQQGLLGDENNTDNQQIEEASTTLMPHDLPEPRQHAYLPGASHPLYPEEWIGRSGCDANGAPASTSYDPLPPTIPAPNSTIVELPILELDDVILFPGCTVPLRLRHPGWVEYLGRKIDEARFGFASNSSDQQQVRIGVMMRSRGTRRRARRRQVRQPRDAPAARGDGDMAGNIAENTGDTAGRTRQGRWRMESLRRGVVRRREPEQVLAEQEEAAEGSDANEGDGLRPNAEAPRRQREDDAEPSFIRPPPPTDPRIGRIGAVAIITYTHEVAAAESEVSPTGGEVTENGDGTDPSHRSRVWMRHAGQLVLTAMGTARFRILSRIDAGSTTLDAEQRVMFRGDMADIKLYAVELLVDENLPLPPIRPLRRNYGSAENFYCGGMVVDLLSRVTPTPSFAYEANWPWRLVDEICKELSEIPVWEGIWKSLPREVDPVTFAFWMAANMPLPASDRLDLLEMECGVERLRFVLVKVSQQRQLERPIRCRQCGETIATISSLFTVGGAEGTTGAYVNEYGIVHQTQTVRTVTAEHVFCVGNRESRDSWFHGYTWTIIHCATCGAHLGWRFDAIRGQSPAESTEDSPKRFFGLTGGLTTTEESSVPRRVAAGLGLVADRLTMNVVRLQAMQGMAAEDRVEASDSDESGGEDEEEEEGEESHTD